MTNVYTLADPEQRSVAFADAKAALSASGLVVMPTDTVYGLACDAFDPTAVRRLLRAKGRGRDMPTPVLVASVDTMRALATNVSAQTRELAAALWPGGLTIICRQQPSLRWDIGDSRGTVALRVPDHPDAIELLLDNGPLAVSSANSTGMPPATTVSEAQEMLRDAVNVYLDAGPTAGPVPSTIVDATGEVLRVVRLGVISLGRLREIVTDIHAPEDFEEEDGPESFAQFASPPDESEDDGYDEVPRTEPMLTEPTGATEAARYHESRASSDGSASEAARESSAPGAEPDDASQRPD